MKNALLYAGIAIVAIGGIAMAQSSKKENFAPPEPQMGPENNPNPTGPKIINLNPIKPLDLEKVLKKGDKGGEVRKLQSLLGFAKPDGDFGDKTLAALIKQKNVNSISVNGFSKVKDVNRTIYPKGTRLMSNNGDGAKTYSSTQKADGTYKANMEFFAGVTKFDYGKAIGTVRNVSADALYYSVDIKGTFSNEVRFVLIADVKNY
ncbi:MAG: hypothetical protein H7174_07850 [Flavobacterium sp.]|nr:hypothetical protein [Flavobacterium sp.]